MHPDPWNIDWNDPRARQGAGSPNTLPAGQSALMSALGLPPTRQGAAALRNLLVSRPDVVRRVGEQLVAQQRSGGLFGTGAGVAGRVGAGVDAGSRLGAEPYLARVSSRRRPGGGADDAFEREWGAIIRNEGGTGPNGEFLTSDAGAVGPGQVMPGTAPEAADLAGLPWDERRYRSDPDYNIALGRAYYREQRRVFGNPDMAAAAYNAGPSRVRQAIRRARERGGSWEQHLPAETRQYLRDFRERSAPR